MNAKVSPPKTRMLSVLLVAAIVVVIGLDVLVMGARPKPAPVGDIQHISAEAARLAGPPPGRPTLQAQVEAVRTAIKDGDFAAATRMIDAVRRQSIIRAWEYRPFSDFLAAVVHENDETLLGRLDEWAARDARSATPFLLRAAGGGETAWATRGSHFSSEIVPRHRAAFQTVMAAALADVDRAIERDASNPQAYLTKLNVLALQGDSPETEAAFQQGIRAFPDFYPLYERRLYTIQPKWGGSVEAMYAFVDRYAGGAPAHAPIKMLYVQLYADLMDVASVACNRWQDEALRRCVESTMGQITTEALKNDVQAALQLYNHTDKSEFSWKVRSLLSSTVWTEGADRLSRAFVQLAAGAMGGDPLQASSNAATDNYVLDRLEGARWYRLNRYQDAETYYKRAIAALPNTRFVDDDAERKARSAIYEDLARLYNYSSQWAPAAIYDRAAYLVLGGSRERPQSSHGVESLYRLRLYPQAIVQGTALYEDTGNLEALYWRAGAYEATGQTKLALADFARAAESEDWFRIYSANMVAKLYGRMNDFAGALAALDSYPYLYDVDHRSKRQLAVAYNSRCYVEMQLGSLNDALKDCTISLQYDTLPDALANQKEIVRRLKTAGKAT